MQDEGVQQSRSLVHHKSEDTHNSSLGSNRASGCLGEQYLYRLHQGNSGRGKQ